MPVQKGKKRRKVRSRGGPSAALTESPDHAASAPKTAARPTRRRTMPTSMKLIMAVFMLAAGLFFFFWNSHTSSTGSRVLFLVIYLVIAGVYLQSALRDYLARRA